MYHIRAVNIFVVVVVVEFSIPRICVKESNLPTHRPSPSALLSDVTCF